MGKKPQASRSLSPAPRARKRSVYAPEDIANLKQDKEAALRGSTSSTIESRLGGSFSNMMETFAAPFSMLDGSFKGKDKDAEGSCSGNKRTPRRNRRRSSFNTTTDIGRDQLTVGERFIRSMTEMPKFPKSKYYGSSGNDDDSDNEEESEEEDEYYDMIREKHRMPILDYMKSRKEQRDEVVAAALLAKGLEYAAD